MTVNPQGHHEICNKNAAALVSRVEYTPTTTNMTNIKIQQVTTNQPTTFTKKPTKKPNYFTFRKTSQLFVKFWHPRTSQRFLETWKVPPTTLVKGPAKLVLPPSI